MKNSQNSTALLSLPLIQKERSKRSFYYFFTKAWDVLEPENPLIDNWHVKYLCDILQEEAERIARKEPKTKDLIINIPPRSLKSMIITTMYNAWVWIKYPHIKFITASYSNELSIEHAVNTRRLIESNWYQERFADSFQMTTDQNVKSKFENNKKGYRRATSVGGTITGQGADIIIGDDLLKVQDTHSELKRNGANEWWKKTMFSRLNNQNLGVRVVVMQRLHEEDLTGSLLSTNSYRRINIPAKLTEDTTEEIQEYYTDGLFFPEVFSESVLQSAKESLGSMAYAGQYLQKPAPDEGGLIKRAWFKRSKPEDIPDSLKVNFYTDGAYGKEGSDNSATIAYSTHDGNVYIHKVLRWNYPFPQFIQRYKQVINELGYTAASRCYFEPKAMGISAVQELKRHGINAIEDKPPVESKVSRVMAGSAKIEAGSVYLSEDATMEELIEEAVVFPNGKYDDAIDALASIIRLEAGKRPFVFVSNY